MSARPERGNLRTYLGTAPGVGKTYAMLVEGRRRAAEGERVVVGWIERHGRAETRAQRGDLEVVPRRTVLYRGRSFDELDVAGVLALRPDVALVDELAHTQVDGSRRRWEDVAELLDAGVDVITTLNVANLLTVREYAAQITGTGTVEAMPDDFVRAGEVVLVDLPPDALRRRIAAGSVYSADGVGGALANYFRAENLLALSELAGAWLEGSIESVGPALVARGGQAETRSTVIAAVSGSEWGRGVIERAAELAGDDGAELLAVHVRVADGLEHPRAGAMDRYRDLATERGGAYVEVDGTSVAEALARVAAEQGASRLVVARHRSRFSELVRGSVATRVRRLLPDVDVVETRPQR